MGCVRLVAEAGGVPWSDPLLPVRVQVFVFVFVFVFDPLVPVRVQGGGEPAE